MSHTLIRKSTQKPFGSTGGADLREIQLTLAPKLVASTAKASALVSGNSAVDEVARPNRRQQIASNY